MLKGHLEMLVLATVAPQPLHGYAVIQALCRHSKELFELPEGTVYPVLHRLEQRRLLASQWTVAAGRRRRVYRITASGRKALAKHRGEWKAFTAAVSSVLGARA